MLVASSFWWAGFWSWSFGKKYLARFYCNTTQSARLAWQSLSLPYFSHYWTHLLVTWTTTGTCKPVVVFNALKCHGHFIYLPMMFMLINLKCVTVYIYNPEMNLLNCKCWFNYLNRHCSMDFVICELKVLECFVHVLPISRFQVCARLKLSWINSVQSS